VTVFHHAFGRRWNGVTRSEISARWAAPSAAAPAGKVSEYPAAVDERDLELVVHQKTRFRATLLISRRICRQPDFQDDFSLTVLTMISPKPGP
jgi:hypothetical protein